MKAFVRSLVRRAVCAWRPRTLVLAYHHVCELGTTAPWITTSPARFAEQMRYLARNGLAVSMDRLLADLRGGGRPPGGRILVTLDDAFTDTWEIAYPILRDAGVPAALFVPTGLIGGDRPGWWDRTFRLSRAAASQGADIDSLLAPGAGDPERCESLRWLDESEREERLGRAAAVLEAPGLEDGPTPMTWGQIAALDRTGLFTLGGHTVSHRVLTGLTDEEIAAEADEARVALSGFASFRPVFAYPYGDDRAFDSRVQRIVQAAGFEAGFTTEQKPIAASDDRMALGRVCIDDLRIDEFRWLIDHYLRS
ncbi:MAG TPA: polysaccharide deacetylase family protein [Gemmataceae bacterium]|nr:polysaccharide deacetylase family protein [Gemmataceae bacterium]